MLGDDASVQALVGDLRARFQNKITDLEQRKAFVYLLARFVKSFHFLTCFFSYSSAVQEFVAFAEYVGPQLIKQGSVSDLMKQIRQTEVVKAAVQFQGVVQGAGTVKLKSGKGSKIAGPVPKKVLVHDMIFEIRDRFKISDEEALYIKEVTEEKTKDPPIQATVKAHKEDRLYLEGPYQRAHKMPKTLEPGILYVSEEYEIAMHLCACGCGSKVSTPLGPTDWTFEDSRRGPSLDPSIGNWQKPCQSHYLIKNGEVIWAPKWTQEEILGGRRREQEQSAAYFAKRERKRNGRLTRLWKCLRRPFRGKHS